MRKFLRLFSQRLGVKFNSTSYYDYVAYVSSLKLSKLPFHPQKNWGKELFYRDLEMKNLRWCLEQKKYFKKCLASVDNPERMSDRLGDPITLINRYQQTCFVYLCILIYLCFIFTLFLQIQSRAQK